MKTLKVQLMIMITLCVAGCESAKEKSIAGIYTTAFKQEFSVVNDTLIIQDFNRQSKSYQVERRTGFRRIDHGNVGPMEYKRTRWMATFNTDGFILQETAFGRQIYFKPDFKSLSFGATYQKVQ
ncbi:hypothetical protein SNE26_20475 [Mucilaginibacter sp. cycad4]|uniref:hypothetical protein n=1 Tax=Mucilaginibacter sp. cycad4 TaxID=3342096 RepID=UPI002AABB871|nr:hypothetical protein [Mucilaginibacter gossypii]WPU98405.1 hypothetical protein SNE26_20475 [Mucilaginibacter gossypii]